MADYSSILTKHIVAVNEQELEKKFAEIQLKTQQMIHVYSIYRKGSSVVAWIRLDARSISVLSNSPEPTTLKKKTTRKKRTTKA